MTTTTNINAEALAQWIAAGRSSVILDVRKEPAFAKDPRTLPGALRVPPDTLTQWIPVADLNKTVVVYCVHGHEVSQGAAKQLRENGFDAVFLEGGFREWLVHDFIVESPRPTS